jgi:predicted dehydrogenase
MFNVGVIGIGGIGATHLRAYTAVKGVRVSAVADLVADRREGRTVVAGNVKGQVQGGVDFARFRKYAEGMDLIADPNLDIVDICLPTPLHARYATAALAAGKHVLTEKPFARTAREANRLVRAAASARGRLMCALCMRFWPAWAWLKEAIDRKIYGRVLAAHFRRVANTPRGGFYRDGRASGGAILDLHIHDTDFVQYCFGKPSAVSSRGYEAVSGAIDHVITHYLYDRIPLVTAEGGWAMAPGFGFQMQYTVNFEEATAVFDLAAAEQLRLVRRGRSEPVKVRPGAGYVPEIAYFVDCLRTGAPHRTATPASAALSVRIVEAEIRSVRTGRPVNV